MKNILLFLLILIAVPAWAGDMTMAPATAKPAAMDSAPMAGVVIKMKGASKTVRALVANLEKEDIYKDAFCSGKASKSGKSAKISCAKADGALLTYLAANASGVHWSISAGKKLSAASICPSGCVYTSCPPPSGPDACCKRTSTGYKTC
jgi:hypothetical protein